MKVNRIVAVGFAAALLLSTAGHAAKLDDSSYGFQVGKEGRTEIAAPYAGKNYEGGEQGDTSAYSFRQGLCRQAPTGMTRISWGE